MVYGFARQSGGHVAIYSEPGHGTTVKLYLPRANPPGALASASAAAGAEPVADPELRGGHECVLVVEDDDAVRQLACQELRALGYEVLQAASGPEALPLLRGDRRIELLFTDVVMPGGPVRTGPRRRSAPASPRSARALHLRLTPTMPSCIMAGWTPGCSCWPSPTGAPTWRVRSGWRWPPAPC
jgi:hypothetical protein